MKRIIHLALCFCFVSGLALAGPRDAQWKEVDEAQKKGLPKTAIEKLDPIIVNTMKDKAWAEAIKAIGRKIALEGAIQGNKPEEKILRMQAEIEKSPVEMKPLMEAILAHWYWQYFQQNRWRFMQRTQTAEPPGKDFTTWDLARILAEIGKHFDAALAAEKTLKATPIAQYDDLLVKGTMPDAYRPTLFDFVAYEALTFYQAGEQAGSKAEDTFELEANSPIFAPAAEFVKWEPDTGDEQSMTLKAIRLYQKLLAFHQSNQDKTAFLDADLQRLNFGYNRAVGDEKAGRYKAELKRLAMDFADHEVSAAVRYHLAMTLKGEGELVEAMKVAKQGAGAFPDSVGGRQCFNLIQQIEAREVSIMTELVWNAPWPTINIDYRNVTRIWFRALPCNFEDRIKNKHNPEFPEEKEFNEILAMKPAREWSADLPPTQDYKQRTEAIPAPKDLKPGFYFIVASHDPGFAGASNNVVSYAPVWVSDLALVMRPRNNSGGLSGFVLNALSGEPVAGASVKAWVMRVENNRAPGYDLFTETIADTNGLFNIKNVSQKNYLQLRVVAQSGDQALASQSYGMNIERSPERQYAQTMFFTDRSLYRPGQTIQYKGLCISVDREKDNYATLADTTISVVFNDVNGKEIGRQKHKSNAYGSFNGSFTAPRDRLAGRMTIHVEGEPHGQTSVTVEEYKRPKFQVELAAPKEAVRLMEKITLTGKAAAYTGAAIGGAKVKWRVTRSVRFPPWWGWYCWWGIPPMENQEIAHGTTATGADGSFMFSFTAKPDLSVPEKNEPTFIFTAYADVTDTSGETRSNQRGINAGYTALQAFMTAQEWLTADKPAAVMVRTTTLDGDGQAADGVVKVYALKQPSQVMRPSLLPARQMQMPSFHQRSQPRSRLGRTSEVAPASDPSNPNSWELGEAVTQQVFKTDASGTQTLNFALKAGVYRATLETQDRFGKPVMALLPVQVVDIAARTFAVKIPNHVAAPAWSVEPGGTFVALWGTGYDKGRAYVEVEHRRKVLKSFWTEKSRTQEMFEFPVSEAMRGGFTFRVTYVRENRAYLESRRVDVPWSNKKLNVKWERFVSKLEPGAKETWTAIITGPDAKRAVAEMVAGLYDASLDAYLPHNWITSFDGFFRHDWSDLRSSFENRPELFRHRKGRWSSDYKSVDQRYRSFPAELTANLWGYGYPGSRRAGRGGGMMQNAMLKAEAAAPPAASMATADGMGEDAVMGEQSKSKMDKDSSGGSGQGGGSADGNAQPAPDLSKIAARKNLQETAFFFPHLVSGADGIVKMEFTMPEALTEWKFMGFAHDRELRSGFLQDKAVTAKDLMVEPNPPRFVREGDVLEFTVKVSNQSAAMQKGTVRLTFADARTLKTMDAELGLKTLDQPFEIAAKESRSFFWQIQVPDGMDFLTYKAVGSTGRLSDGEEGYLPVLSRRILVTESLPLPIRGAQTKKFDFNKLRNSGKSDTLRHQSLTVQMVSQPAWYAVMALPYLMEYPYECTEQTFNRLYANMLARHIAGSNPKIRNVFDQWKGTPALDSPLEKNQDLKAVMLDETPWLRQAQDESRARKNVGILFDENRLNDETARLLQKIAELQLGDGRWPWFPGGHGNEYITLYITTGFGRMRHLGVKLDVASAVKSLNSLDAWIDEIYRKILEHGDKNRNNLSPTIALYLYGRSFFLEDQPVAAGHKGAVDYFLGQARQYWLQVDNRQSQAHLAVALKRFGDKETPRAIMASLKERSVSNEEMGMFWRDTELSWWWFRAPIETQAMMIEAFDEVMADAAAVENCKVWLLKQKQTQDWKTTKATADAIYALLLRGTDLLASDALVEVSLGGKWIKPEKVEAGTGFYEQRFTRGEIKPVMGEITVKKVDEGVSWGSAHWQYLEDISKVTPHEGTPLKLKKDLFVKENTAKGPMLSPLKGALKVGDELVVRVTLRTDRDMEYVHLKDQRGSGTEPVNVLSRYKYQDGLAYYESTKDTASHFFIDYLPKGTYVFEYSTRAVHKGKYQSGMAEIQCMYAPEFNSHSESFELKVE